MPELPEVETIAQGLKKAKLEGRTIENAIVSWPKSAATKHFVENIKDRKILKVSRRGKNLVFKLSKGFLIIHLRMTGRLSFDVHSPYERIAFKLDDGRYLKFIDTRKFGRAYLVDKEDEVLGKLGPEPLEIELKDFKALISGKKRQLKPLLLDQTFLAGIGNIYVDEALWEARLHPLTRADALTEPQVKALFHAIQNALLKGIERQGTTLGSGKTNYYQVDGSKGKNATKLQVFRRTGKKCPRCETIIERIVVGQRSTHICRECQKGIK